MIEEWKDIKGYEGLYQISSLGRVMSFKTSNPKLLKSTKECAKTLGLIPTNITQALKKLNKNGTKKTLKGYTFKYKEVV